MTDKPEYRNLTKVLVSKADLLTVVRENLANHREVFEQAMAGYKTKVLALLDEHMKRVLDNDPTEVRIHIPMPSDHSEDYEQTIRMLEMSQDQYLELSEREFAQYVMDQWGWETRVGDDFRHVHRNGEMMGLFGTRIEELTDENRTLSARVAELQGEEDYHRDRRDLQDELYSLKEKIEKGKIERERQVEAHEREKREVAHKVGLERTRQEDEAERAMKDIAVARRDAVLEVREANLADERKAFEKQMDFITKRFGKEVGYLKEIMTAMMERLPEISVGIKRNGDDNG